MLQLTGKVLGTNTQKIGEGEKAFIKETVRVQSGSGFETQIYDAGFGRDFPNADKPREGEDVVLNVVIGTYQGRNGVGYNLTALSREHKTSKTPAHAG